MAFFIIILFYLVFLFYLELKQLQDDNKKLEKELAEIRKQMELISSDLIQKLKDNNV